MTNFGLSYVPGVEPPHLPQTPAVGFSTSSVTAQTAAVNANGVAAKFDVGPTPVEIISNAITGTAVVQLLGGAPCWIGFSDSITPETASYRLVIDDPITVQPIVQLWAVGLNDPDVPKTLVQTVLIESQ